jgi:hypothetical protein
MGQQGRKVVVLMLLFLLNLGQHLALVLQHPLLNFLLFLDGTESVVGTLMEDQLLIMVLLSVVEPCIGCSSILDVL